VHCPYCRHTDTRVLDSRVADDGASIRRRRQCPECGSRFSTSEQMQLSVIKRSGVVEAFNRDKVVAGVRKACKGRPVTDERLARLGQQVEDVLRSSGQPEVPTGEVGVAILGPLRELDQVAYLRFASVYRQFTSVDDFESEIATLRDGQNTSGLEPLIPELDVDPVPHRQSGSRTPAAGHRRSQTRSHPGARPGKSGSRPGTS
jgi:transcriptional repressor NrdR